jgi:hypothetical protein
MTIAVSVAAVLFAGFTYAEVSKEVLDSISTPNEVQTSIGTLKLLDGAPYPGTAEKVYDFIDTMRGVDAFLKGIPGASVHMLIHGARKDVGAEECHQVMIFDKLMDSRPFFLTGNTSTMYLIPDFDLLRDGPTVAEVPPGALGAMNDAWFRYIGDVGPAGPDKGKGGKYLVLPPGYEGKVPKGYHVVRSPSYDVWFFMRFSIKQGLDKAVATAKTLKIYPLSKKDNPPAMEFINASGKAFNTVHANDFKFYREVNSIIQKEPLELLDPEMRGLYASIGIQKGKPFNPDARMKKILVDAVAIANAAARSIVWYPRAEGTMKGIKVYPGQNSAWNLAFLGKNVFFNGKDGHTMNTEARLTFHYPYTAVTPAMALTRPGAGSDYAIAYVDSEKQPFDGSKVYRLRVPANPPVKEFWAATVYDPQTRSQLQTSQPFPTVGSQTEGIKKNADGSTDIYFAPAPPKGYENNWVQTVPGKGWFTIFRMYAPLQAWIDKSWRPGEIELVDMKVGPFSGELPKSEIPEDVLASISTPDEVNTSIGTLKFLDGAPYPETAQKVYDFLDTMRGVDVFLKSIPAASIHELVKGNQHVSGGQAHQIVLFDKLMDPKSLFLTANSSTMYIFPTLDLERDGPTVIEAPPAMQGMINDAWFRYVMDIGPAGPDKGKGGKYLVLPPGYEGNVPKGYFVVRPKTYEHWLLLRTSIKDGIDVAEKRVKDHLRVYPLCKADNPPKTEFVSGSGVAYNTVHANDFSFYEHVNEVIQKEPLEAINPEIRGLLAAIGIEKGKPFEPDARMKKILVDAVAIGNAAARSIVWHPRIDGNMKGLEVYPGSNSSWMMGWVDKNVFFTGKDGKTMNSDARTHFHYVYTGVTPAMALTRAGAGSDYGIAYVDKNKQPFDGSKTYRLRLPPNPPAGDFWALTVYDPQTRSMLETGQPFPTVGSQTKGIKKNKDGSYDIYFAPKPPKGFEDNWVETIPGKGWFVALRMYAPKQEWIDKTWRPGEIELIK